MADFDDPVKVSPMPNRPRGNDDIEKLLVHPPFWLIYALEWPQAASEAPMAEAAFAVAPHSVPSVGIPQHVEDVVGFTRLYNKEHPAHRAVWFTDVTRWLDTKDQSWASLGVDWERALLEIPELPILGLYLTISRRAYSHLGSAAKRHTIFYSDGSREDLGEEERDAVHDALERTLNRDWPSYVREMLTSGRLTIG
ncbi:hypothetical protein [Actinophytocola xanthii]|uniref:Uncharacterized protein n=1 Tax=Actinophytocola xanthii TaxID=1912961 RepID=A0A1Q8CK25_9PSEU|nr:hypothetical protein [Actinophytocola xanthii]OLF14725.1 hypothetical protein BU204_25260 [Actinophytocola xanthii]